MSTVAPDFTEPSPPIADFPATQWTVADVLAHLPEYPADRICTYPAPGTATEDDVLDAESRTGYICELIDGTLVKKVMASRESLLAAALIHYIYLYLDTNNIGAVFAPDGLLKILTSQIRAPDVSFIRWERFPGGRLPEAAIYAVSPNLAAEILSKGNTKAEMDRKLRDYFRSGVQLVWYIDPKTRTAKSYRGKDDCQDIAADGLLSGGEVLPGFELKLADLFARVEGPEQA